MKVVQLICNHQALVRFRLGAPNTLPSKAEKDRKPAKQAGFFFGGCPAQSNVIPSNPTKNGGISGGTLAVFQSDTAKRIRENQRVAVRAKDQGCKAYGESL